MSEKGPTNEYDEAEGNIRDILEIFEKQGITNDSHFMEASEQVLATILKNHEEKCEGNLRDDTNKLRKCENPEDIRENVICIYHKAKIKQARNDRRRAKAEAKIKQHKQAATSNKAFTDEEGCKTKEKSQNEGSHQDKREGDSESPNSEGAEQYQKMGCGQFESWQTDGASHTEPLETENSCSTEKLQEKPGDERSKGGSSRRSSNVNIKQIVEIVSEEEISQLSNRQLREILVKNEMDAQDILEKEDLVNEVKRLWKQTNSQNQEREIPQEQICKICFSSNINCVLLECGHSLTCIECGQKIKECPVCRTYVVKILRIFK